MALAGKWEMNLEETSSVTLETSGTAMLQTEGLEKQIPKRLALCRTCPRVEVPLLHSWFHPPVVKEEQQQFAMAEGCRDGRFSLEVFWVLHLGYLKMTAEFQTLP